MIGGRDEFWAENEIDMPIEQAVEQYSQFQIDWREKNEWQVDKVLFEEPSKEQVRDVRMICQLFWVERRL